MIEPPLAKQIKFAKICHQQSPQVGIVIDHLALKILFLSAFLALVGAESMAYATSPDADNQRPKVMVAQAILVDLADELLYPAIIVPKRSIAIVAEVEGFIKSVGVRLGDRVKQGDEILTVANPDPVYRYKPFVVTAPFSGTVTSALVVAGDRIERGRPLVNLVDLNSLVVKINVTRNDLKLLAPSSRGHLTIDSHQWSVEVRALSPMIDIATGTAPCELELVVDKGQPLTRPTPGSVGQVKFLLNQRKGIRVPDSAIVYRGEVANIIKVIDKNRAQYFPVKILASDHGSHELASGSLIGGETFVIESFGFIIDGEEVALIPNQGT